MESRIKLIGRNLAYERWRWQIFGITWLAYFGFYLTRKSLSVAIIGIEADPTVDFSLSEFAWTNGGYLMAYAAGQLLWGIAGDKLGTRLVILTGMLCSILTAAAMGASSIALAFGVLFLVQGLWQSTGWAPLVKNVGNFFSQRERGTVMGFWCTNYAVGGLVASAYAGYWGDKLGWRFAFFLPAATLFAIWLLFYLFQRNKPEDVGLMPIEEYHAEKVAVIEEGEPEAEEQEGTWKTIIEVLTQRTVLTLSAVYFLLKPTRYAILFYGPKYINERIGSGMTESGVISGMFELAGIFSVLIGGYVSDKLFDSRRMPVSVICLFSLGFFLFFVDDLPATRTVLAASLLLIGFLLYAPDSLVSGAAAIDFGTKKGASTAAGFVNFGGSVGAIIGGTVPGFFAAQWGWNGVFMFLGGMVLIAGFILLPKWNALPPTANGPGSA